MLLESKVSSNVDWVSDGRTGESCSVRSDANVESRLGLTLQKRSKHFCLGAGIGVTAVKVIAKWSDMERLVLLRTLISMWLVE